MYVKFYQFFVRFISGVESIPFLVGQKNLFSWPTNNPADFLPILSWMDDTLDWPKSHKMQIRGGNNVYKNDLY